LSTESGITLNCTSGLPFFACAVQAAPPTWPAPTVSGPELRSSHSTPIAARRERIADLVVERDPASSAARSVRAW
jgi:hypothetical protein